jgi:hypothetical protein
MVWATACFIVRPFPVTVRNTEQSDAPVPFLTGNSSGLCKHKFTKQELIEAIYPKCERRSKFRGSCLSTMLILDEIIYLKRPDNFVTDPMAVPFPHRTHPALLQ